MILPIKPDIKSFRAQDSTPEPKYTKDTLLKNNASTRMRIGFDKLGNALTLYPVKGLKGDKNSNFYEFLTMGIVPYIAGSAMLMAVFNTANKFFEPFARAKAKALGAKMSLGVVLYGLFKEISKSFITKPVKAVTGVDTEIPYAKVVYELPDDVNDTDITSIEYHKVFESVDFPRWDLLYKDGENRNEYFDKVAKKMGLGENLQDSDQEVKPHIKDLVTRTKTAKNISSYTWAAVGVALAFQDTWSDYFNCATANLFKFKKFGKSIKQFGKSFKNAAKSLYNGSDTAKGFAKHSGKALLATAVLSSAIGVANAIIGSKKSSKAENFIDTNQKYVEN